MHKRRALSLLLLPMALALAACGFHLRGSGPEGRLPFKSVYLDMARNIQLERDVRNAMRAQGDVEIAGSPRDAEAILHIISDLQERKMLTLNAQGQTREYSLTYRLHFEVKDAAGNELLKPSEIALQQYMSYSESQAIAKEAEQELIFADLRNEAISQMLRRITLLRRAAKE